MIINFQHLTIHNFLSYGHAELDLRNKHYCIVKGVNNATSDNATSNGSGKSSWSSAICWALTGETIQGLSTNIKNINVAENVCYVELLFSVDADTFKICRYKSPKSDLKIELNGIDISGKGIRESQDILSRYLPDITSQLIASTIILGQGLPNKFTANSPSGRKEVLEQLSKSDFMIQDLKSRINARQQILSKDIRDIEDLILSSSARKTALEEAVKRTLATLSELNSPQSFDVKIYELKGKITAAEIEVARLEALLTEQQEKLKAASVEISKEISLQDSKLNEEKSEFETFKAEYLSIKSEYLAKISALTEYITKVANIVDICPTCNQKIPNIQKPEAKAEKQQLAELQIQFKEFEARYKSTEQQHIAAVAEIKNKNAEVIQQIKEAIEAANSAINTLSEQIRVYSANLTQYRVALATEETNKKELSNRIATCESEISNYNIEISELHSNIETYRNKHSELNERMQSIIQLNTLVKRDFRGYLLSEIISFIAEKSKEYCLNIFGTDAIEFSLDGNNINISYAGKAFENLSGGEKQRVDLIIQFAIRNMMEYYLNFSSNILVLDEIFDQLDVIGCESVLDLISTKLSDIESIFIISHRADELEIPCDYELTVIKNQEGVSKFK